MTDETCHCGRPLAYGFNGDPTHTRGMCEACDAVRCDAYPDACYGFEPPWDGKGDWDEVRCDCPARLRAEADATKPSPGTPLIDVTSHARRAAWYRLAADWLEATR